MRDYWKKKEADEVELIGPLECPNCGGHVALDATFLEQVEDIVVCPYCDMFAMVGADIIGEEYESEVASNFE